MTHQRGFAMTMALYLIGAVAVLSIIVGGIWKIHHTGYVKGKAEVQLAWDQAKAEQREKEAKAIDTATTKLETNNAKAKVIYRTITRNVDKIVTRDVYRNVCLDPDGVSAINAALRGPNAPPSEPSKPVPRPDAPR